MKLIGWYRWLMPAAALALSISGAAAQLKPWPDQQPQPQPQTRAWPGENPPAGSGGAQPAAVQPVPMAPAAAPMMAAPGFGAPAGPPRENPCMTEFSRLRGEVEKAGKTAKVVNDRKGTREEFCKAFTGLHNAQVKWVKYAQGNAQSCGIPSDIITQLKAGEANLGKMRTNICNGGATAGGPPTPSLAEALGTASMPVTEDVAKKRGGTLDTLTGQSIR
jgi:hypothetical protein